MISPLSLTVVSPSSSRITAFTSSAYCLADCWARLRSQSGTPATAIAGPKASRQRTKIELIAFLCIGNSRPQDCLLFITGLDFAEEIFQFCELFNRQINSIEKQGTLGNQFAGIKLAGVLVSGIR